MKQDYTKILTDILGNLAHLNHIQPSEIPHINLYMDQVTGFMEEHLSNSKRFEDDKILTKTMINNYAKNRLLPPPEKKKYSKDHMLLLLFIYYFKNILSINDIQKLLTPMTDRYFKNEDGADMTWLYSHIMDREPEQSKRIGEDILHLSEDAQKIFVDCPEDEQEYLHLLSVISLLSYDVYMKKQLIEKLIDSATFLEDVPNTKKKK